MRYIEKQFPARKADAIPLMKPIPRWVRYQAMKRNMDKQLPSLRKNMGGDSQDITTRAILMQDHIIDGHTDKIKVRRYWPAVEAHPRKMMLYFHGGGWFGGSIWAVEEYLKGLSDRADCVVLSVEYHLAPEHPFPEGLMDCHKAMLWAWERAEQLGGDRSNLILSGDSAGGNFAAALSIMARDEKTVQLAGQVLLYPCVDLTDPGMASPLGKDMGLIEQVFIGWYLQSFPDIDDPRVSPIKAKDLSGLPRAMLVTCEFDALKEQGRAYAEALFEAGVESVLVHYLNTRHGFIDDTGTLEQGLDLIREVVKFLNNTQNS